MFVQDVFLGEVFYERHEGVTAPGAGNEIEEGLGNRPGFRLQLMGYSFRLTTDATVADRRVQVVIRNLDAGPSIISQAQVVQTAGLAVDYFVGPGYVASTSIIDNRVLMRLPFPPLTYAEFAATEGWTLETDTVNLQAGDAYTNIEYYGYGSEGRP